MRRQRSQEGERPPYFVECCPFCEGEKARVITARQSWRSRVYFGQVECLTCHARGPRSESESRFEAAAMAATLWDMQVRAGTPYQRAR